MCWQTHYLYSNTFTPEMKPITYYLLFIQIIENLTLNQTRSQSFNSLPATKSNFPVEM